MAYLSFQFDVSVKTLIIGFLRLRLAYGHVCGTFSWLLIDVGWSNLLEDVVILGQVILGYRRKGAEQTGVSKPISSFPL